MKYIGSKNSYETLTKDRRNVIIEDVDQQCIKKLRSKYEETN